MKKIASIGIVLMLFMLLGCNAIQLPTYLVSGVVQDTNSALISNATVTISGNSTTTDSKGVFNLSGIRGGNYLLTCSKVGYETKEIPISVFSNMTKNVTLTEISEVTLFTLNVQNKDETTYDLINATLSLKDLKTKQIVSTKSGTQVSFEIPAGDYQITAEADGYVTVIETFNLVNDKNITLKFTPKQTEPEETYQLRVRSKVGDIALTEASVKLIDTYTNVTKTKTGNDVTFTNLYAGNYEVEVTHPQCVSDNRPVSITDKDKEIEVQLTWLPASVSGTVSIGSKYFSQSNKTYGKLSSNIKTVELSTMSLSDDVSNGLLVQFYDDVTEERIQEILLNTQQNGYTNIGPNLYRIDVSGDQYLIMETLDEREEVEFVQLNHVNHLMSIAPNDPKFNEQWNLTMINMPAAWEYIKGSDDKSIIVAVLDTGIRYHSDVFLNLVPGYDVVDNDTEPYDDVTPAGEASHGTHCASIIGAVTNNGSGLAGVGWNISVMPIKVFTNDPEAGIVCYDDAVIAGIYKAVEKGAKVINLSLGSHDVPSPADHPLYENALRYARENDVLVVASTGNEEAPYLSYPASSEYTMAVGAVDYYGNRAWYSNYGTGIDLVAPGGSGGGDYFANWILGYGMEETNQHSGIYGMAGTSQAAPHVSAVAGLLYTMGITNLADVYDILINTAYSKQNVNEYGAGILDAEAAVMMAADVPKVSIEDANIYAATLEVIDGANCYTNVTSAVNPDSNGDYNLTRVPLFEDIYIIGWIDVDEDGKVTDGDYFGQTSTSHNYKPNETLQNMDFELTKYEQYTTNSFQTSSIRQKITLITKK